MLAVRGTGRDAGVSDDERAEGAPRRAQPLGGTHFCRLREQEQMCLLLREALTVGKIAFHQNFLSVELNAPEAKNALKDEMMNYCVVTEAAKTTFGKVNTLFTQKPPHDAPCPQHHASANDTPTHTMSASRKAPNDGSIVTRRCARRTRASCTGGRTT